MIITSMDLLVMTDRLENARKHRPFVITGKWIKLPAKPIIEDDFLLLDGFGEEDFLTQENESLIIIEE